MSKAAKQIMVILTFLLVGSMCFAGYALLEKEKAVKAKVAIEKQLDTFQIKAKNHAVELKAVEDRAKQAETAKAEIQQKLSGVDQQIEDFNKKIETLTQDRDNWQKRVEILQKERQEMLAKLREKPKTQSVYRDRPEDEPDTPGTGEVDSGEWEKDGGTSPPDLAGTNLNELGDDYWANVLKEKASLELKVEELNGELSQIIVSLEEMRKENSDLQLDLSNLKNEKANIERQIKHGKDLADTLSLELARAKSDKRFVEDRFEAIKNENSDLRLQIKNLTSTKIALEKSIVRITGEKNDIARQLVETESVIQGKIEEIWQIKESINDKVSPSPGGSSAEIELPPIVVSASGPTSPPSPAIISSSNQNGNILSINKDSNFVILDLGHNDGVSIGDKFSIYRDTDFVAEVEIIQTRADISAADIKTQSSNIQVGDVVR